MRRLPTASEVWDVRLSRAMRLATWSDSHRTPYDLQDSAVRSLMRDLVLAVGECRDDGITDGLADRALDGEPLFTDPRPLAVLDRLGEHFGIGPRPRPR